MTLRIPEQVVWSCLDGKLVLFDSSTESYYGLNEVGSSIWRLAAKRLPIVEIIATLCAEYDVDESRAATEVERFLDRLAAIGLLVADLSSRL
jgi:hypothetical protein